MQYRKIRTQQVLPFLEIFHWNNEYADLVSLFIAMWLHCFSI
jgi:hypothetical protein